MRITAYSAIVRLAYTSMNRTGRHLPKHGYTLPKLSRMIGHMSVVNWGRHHENMV